MVLDDRSDSRFGVIVLHTRLHSVLSTFDLEKVRASLDKTCPKCGFTITPDQVKRVDFDRIECTKCCEKFQSNATGVKSVK
jgi:hypothetical protein